MNNGHCSPRHLTPDDLKVNDLNGFKCDCSDGYTGIYCEDFIGERFESSMIQVNNINCLNGGYKDNNSCVCPPGFTGARCQVKVGIFHKNQYNKQFHTGCLNNGYQPKEGLPCKCPEGFYGFMCEFMTNAPSDSLTACIKAPCRNGGICTPTSYGSYACICRNGFYGHNCENLLYRRTYGGFESLLPFLLFFSLITMCVYCCCFKKNRAFNTTNFINRSGFNDTLEPVQRHRSFNFRNNQTPNQVIYVNSDLAEAPKNNADLPPTYEEAVKPPTSNTNPPAS